MIATSKVFVTMTQMLKCWEILINLFKTYTKWYTCWGSYYIYSDYFFYSLELLTYIRNCFLVQLQTDELTIKLRHWYVRPVPLVIYIRIWGSFFSSPGFANVNEFEIQLLQYIKVLFPRKLSTSLNPICFELLKWC